MTDPIVDVAGVVLLRGGEVLLLEPGAESSHVEGVWGVPAGRLEAGETPLEAAVRETMEETGLVLDPDSLVAVPRRFIATLARRDGSSVKMRWHVFAGEDPPGEAIETLEGRPRWVDLDRLADHRLQTNVGAAVAEALVALGRPR